MLQFQSDYLEGAHPQVLARLCSTNLEQTPGYGEDEYCKSAADRIRAWLNTPQAQVHFLVGGTQTNATLIDAALRPHQGVIAAVSAHINAHESGAIEFGGHKILALPTENGKITAAQIRQLHSAHWQDASREHTVQPALVYLSFPTETGLLYTRAELTEIYAVCRTAGLYLYIDGARLGYGLASKSCDVTPAELPGLCDAFTIGGTKQGLLFGEALVLLRKELQQDFRYLLKQHGGMLAKGRLLGLQFDTIFRDNLYLRLSRQADELALLLRESLLALGLPLYYDSPTNQQYPVLPDAALERLRRDIRFEHWCRVDETHCAVRFCTSWATRPEAVEQLLASVRACL